MTASDAFIVVSNRLPVDFDAAESARSGRPIWRAAPGGLVAALEPLLRERGGTWIGWPGVADLELEPFEYQGLALHPLRLSAEDVAEYYEGFANDTIWPLYHDVISAPSFDRGRWERYRAVNLAFAATAARLAGRGATVWVHDYQLQLVPALLRELRSDLRIGYFHHIPFPGYNLFAQLPWRRQVLHGLLGADVIGFQRRGDVANFRLALHRLLGIDARGVAVDVPGEASLPGHRTLVRSYPISIDVAATEALARAALPRIPELRAELGGPEVILLGVDRLDYTKGIGHRLAALGELLAEGRIDPARTLFVQIASPSRERVDAYAQLRDEIELVVGRINGDYSSLSRPAIAYLHTSLPHEEMAALYLAADVMLVTALRDGMNLVAKEFVASRLDEDGVLVLSEFAGAADELEAAVIVNPHDIESLKEAILRAIEMPLEARRSRMLALRRAVHAHTVTDWAQDFLQALDGEQPIPPGVPGTLERALERLAGAPRVLVALDFDGTLAPLVDEIAAARALPEVAAAIGRLAGSERIRLALVSGRSLESLRQVAGPLAELAVLVGSHGLELADGAGGAAPAGDLSAELAELLERAAASVPGMLLERKPFSLALHWRAADPSAAAPLVRRVRAQVAKRWPQLALQTGKDVLEFLLAPASKGHAVRLLAEQLDADATVYFGDDDSDEDVFARLEPGDVGVRVSAGRSLAEFRLAGPLDVALALERLSAAVESGTL